MSDTRNAAWVKGVHIGQEQEMSTPKPRKSSDSHTYSVKYSNKTGGAYADIKAVIQSERENWSKSDKVSQADRDQDLNRDKKQ